MNSGFLFSVFVIIFTVMYDNYFKVTNFTWNQA